MRCACVDIGSNTTRLLVADVLGALPREVLARKVHTHLGRALRSEEAPGAVAARIAAGVAEQVAAARSAGVQRLRVVATAAVRDAAGGDALCEAVRAASGVPVEVLPEDEEARLAFRGATATASPGGAAGGRVAVVDVGGGSTELAIGHPDGTVHRCASVPVGSGLLADAHLRTDPPGPEQLAAVRWAASDAADALLERCGAAGPVDRALAVGGSATSLSRIAGPRLDATSVAVAVATIAAAPSEAVAERTGLLPERLRLLPAGLLLLAAVADRLGRPLELGCGGLREGVCLELAAG